MRQLPPRSPMNRSRFGTWSRCLVGLAALTWMAGCAPEIAPEPEASGGVLQVEQEATASAEWTRWISEEDGQGEYGGVRCPEGKVAIGVECHGDFCDNVRLRCDTFQGMVGGGRWGNWVEHTAGTQFKCGTNEWVAGIQCWGDWCDNVRVWCAATSNAPSGCYWTPQTYSEEHGAYTAPPSEYVAGIECSGNHCDSKRYWVCKTRPAAANSCAGRCGGASSGGTCFCDASCGDYGDCCTDFERICG